jgi:hypothetical protein
MNIWIKRSLGTAVVAGGLLFAGAAVASACNCTGSSTSSLGTSLSAPVEIGGAHVGIQRDKSRTQDSSATRTGTDGKSTSTKRSSTSSKDSIALDTGKISADPAATLRREKAPSKKRTGQQNRTDASSSRTSGAVAAPVRVGGATLSVERAKHAEDYSSSISNGSDGTQASEYRRTTEDKKTAARLGTGDLTVKPQASIEKADTARTGQLRAESSESTKDLRAAAPITFGGIDAGLATERTSTQRTGDCTIDENGHRMGATSTRQSRQLGGGISVGRLSAKPAAVLQDGRSGTGDGNSSSASAVQLSSPFSFDGVGAGLSATRESSRWTSSTVIGDKGTTHCEQLEQSAKGLALGGASGPISGAPSLGLADERAEGSNGSNCCCDCTSNEPAVSTVASYLLPTLDRGLTLASDVGGAGEAASSSLITNGEAALTRIGSGALVPGLPYGGSCND